jgi:hypothetical protein
MKIQATITAHAKPTAPDGNTMVRRSGITRTTLREKATAKSDQKGNLLMTENERLTIRRLTSKVGTNRFSEPLSGSLLCNCGFGTAEEQRYAWNNTYSCLDTSSDWGFAELGLF